MEHNNPQEDYFITSIILLGIVLMAIAFLLTGCSTKQKNMGEFICDCNCKDDKFECRLQIDKQTKILHNEGNEDGKFIN